MHPLRPCPPVSSPTPHLSLLSPERPPSPPRMPYSQIFLEKQTGVTDARTDPISCWGHFARLNDLSVKRSTIEKKV